MKKGGARRFFKSAFTASLLVSGIVSISFADPGNTGGGTQSPPGQAGEHNPHGSPPGQGGSVPGNSGAHNPHGTPPGQRITLPAHTGVATQSQSGQGSIPCGPSAPSGAIHGGVVFAELDKKASEMRQLHKIADLDVKLKGWEQSWLQVALRYDSVRVGIDYGETRGAFIFKRNTVFWKSGERQACREDLSGTGLHEWRFLPDGMWNRLGKGEWRKGISLPINAGRTGNHLDIPSVWKATPVDSRKLPGGRTLVRLIMNDYSGWLEWEVEQVSGQVERIRALDSIGKLAWEETRTYETVGGQSLLATRKRK